MAKNAKAAEPERPWVRRALFTTFVMWFANATICCILAANHLWSPELGKAFLLTALWFIVVCLLDIVGVVQIWDEGL